MLQWRESSPGTHPSFLLPASAPSLPEEGENGVLRGENGALRRRVGLSGGEWGSQGADCCSWGESGTLGGRMRLSGT